MLRPAGERSILVEVAGDQTPAAVAAALRAAFGEELVDVVPGHETVLATWVRSPPDSDAIVTGIAGRTAAAPVTDAPLVVIPTVYDGEDLAEVADIAGLSVEGVIARHTATEYRALFLGFLPGFAYLVSDDPSLHVPRRADPRTEIPAGAVALGGEYCSVYPRASPGGWQLLGTTAATLFDPDRSPPALLEPGTRVRFEAVRG